MSRLRADFRTAMLGAFAGLFTFSVFLLVDRVEVYYEHLAHLDRESYTYSADRVQDLWWMPIALWHALMFVLAGFVAHRYFAHLRDSPFLLWQLVGIGALCGWGLTIATSFALDSLMHSLAFSYDRMTRGVDLSYVAKFVAAVFAGNAVCASFLHSAARQYVVSESVRQETVGNRR